MEAKDTVMNEEQRDAIYLHISETFKGGDLTRTHELAQVEAQAEIAFKVGKETGYLMGLGEGIAKGSLVGEKAGRREVVEEYNAVRACTHMVGYHCLKDCKECEQAQKKEWGI